MKKNKILTQKKFTIIELLICIVILLVLAALLLPSLSNVKRKTVRVNCLSNFRQCFNANVLYAKDNDRIVVRGGSRPWGELDTYYQDKDSDIRILKPYLKSFELWSCPNVDQTIKIDNPINNNDHSPTNDLRCNYQYYPGNISTTTYFVSHRMDEQVSTDIIMSDQLYTWRGRYRSNHVNGGKDFKPYTYNPSLVSYQNGIPYGLNAVYADGHANWVDLEDTTREQNAFFSPLKYYIPLIEE